MHSIVPFDGRIMYLSNVLGAFGSALFWDKGILLTFTHVHMPSWPLETNMQQIQYNRGQISNFKQLHSLHNMFEQQSMWHAHCFGKIIIDCVYPIFHMN